jgi:MFS family permease
VLVFGVSERALPKRKAKAPLEWSALGKLGSGYWVVVGAGAIFTLARFSEAFLVIRAHEAGLPLAWTPAVIGIMSLVYALTAYPAGRLQDRIGATPLLLIGLIVLIAADLALALSGTLLGIFVGIGLWGLHMGLTQGVLSALIAASAPASLRGTAFGLFGLVVGATTLIASLVAGLLWDRFGPQATFEAGAAFAGLALVAFLILYWQGGSARASRPI